MAQPAYTNDILPPDVVLVDLDGIRLATHPSKFGAKYEIMVRDAYQAEEDVINDKETYPSVWARTSASRKVIIDAGKVIIPRCVDGWTPERVEEEMTVQQISTLMGFFLHTDSTSSGLTVLPRNSSATPPIQETQESQKPKRKVTKE